MVFLLQAHLLELLVVLEALIHLDCFAARARVDLLPVPAEVAEHTVMQLLLLSVFLLALIHRVLTHAILSGGR
jgi:hypothetical protein